MTNYINELEFKREFRKRWTGWSDTVEPALGSGMGISDLLVLIKHRRISFMLPIEAKLGSVRKKRVYPLIVRGAQVRWHFHLNQQGGRSALIVGVNDEEAYLIDGKNIVDWKIGFQIGKTATRIFFECETNLTVREMLEEFFKS